jgi:diadenosine tetraphosphate (Ap4A) HIT family hydrolase
MLPVVGPSPFCSIPANRVWIESEHAIAFAADAPAAEGHIVIVPTEHVPSIHALPIAAQKDVWALVSEVRGRLRTGLVPDQGFAVGFVDGLEAAPAPHAAIHIIPRRAGDQIALPECSKWISDDGLLA